MSFTFLTESGNIIDTSANLCAVEIDRVDEHAWHCILGMFEDANLAQTWSYGAARWGGGNLSHILLKRDGEIVAAAQAVIRRVPLVGAGMAYVKCGPLWQRRGKPRDLEMLRQVLRALREFYIRRCGLLLRIFPAPTTEDIGAMRSIFKKEGFERDFSIGTPRTVFMDLSHSLEDLRSSLKPTWRRNLVLAERNNLFIKHGVSDELFDSFVTLYRQMLGRKRIVGVVRIDYFKEMQRTLPEALKMRVMICEHQGEAIAGLVVPYIGNTAQNVLAATGDRGLDLRGSYLLHWRMLEWLKAQGCRWYDLDAVNHAFYPGISQFKMGFAGRLGCEAERVGRFEYCASTPSRLSIRAGEQLRATCRALLRGVNAWRRTETEIRGKDLLQ